MSTRPVSMLSRCAILMVAALVWWPASARAERLVACGWDEVFVIDTDSPGNKLWSWRAADRPELPEAYRALFRTTDECKPVDGHRLLITASSDGAALVDRTTGAVQWWGRCGNTHSAALLPRERVVLACSVREGTGNRLVVFDVGVAEREVFSTELHSGHGAVWDAERQLLWALGMDELRAYTLRDWDSSSPRLTLAASHALPDRGGHELTAVPGSPRLILSTHASVWTFDRDARTFAPHPTLAGRHDVKGVSVHPVTGRVAVTQAEPPNWWTSRIQFFAPGGALVLDGERLYKVRWLP